MSVDAVGVGLASGEELRTLTGHSSWVSAVAICPDSQSCVSASDDKTLKVWDLASGDCVATFVADHGIYCCGVSADGKTFVCGDASGKVHLLALHLAD